MAFKTKVVTTYGDLKHGETIYDKSENAWIVLDPTTANDEVSFSLADPSTPSIPAHNLVKSAHTEVTVIRAKGHATKVAEAEAEVDEAQGNEPTNGSVEPTTGQAVEVLKEELGAEVIAEQSAEEHDALAAGEVNGDPAELPGFTEFSDLEARSHLYLVHGIYAHDVEFREALREMHDEAHADPAARFVPHVHVHGADVPLSNEQR